MWVPPAGASCRAGVARHGAGLARLPRKGCPEPPSYLAALAGDAAPAAQGGPGSQEQKEAGTEAEEAATAPEQGDPAVLSQPHGVQHGGAGAKGLGVDAAFGAALASPHSPLWLLSPGMGQGWDSEVAAATEL